MARAGSNNKHTFEKYNMGAVERLRLNTIKSHAFNKALESGLHEEAELIAQITVVADNEEDVSTNSYGETFFKNHFHQYFTEE